MRRFWILATIVLGLLLAAYLLSRPRPAGQRPAVTARIEPSPPPPVVPTPRPLESSPRDAAAAPPRQRATPAVDGEGASSYSYDDDKDVTIERKPDGGIRIHPGRYPPAGDGP